MSIRLFYCCMLVGLFSWSRKGVADSKALIRELEESRELYFDDPQQAIHIYRRIVDRLQPTEDTRAWLQAIALSNAASHHIGQTKDVLLLLEKALPIAERSPYHGLHAQLLMQKIGILHSQGKQEQIENLLEKADQLANKDSDIMGRVAVVEWRARQASEQGKSARYAALMREAYQLSRAAPRTVRYYAMLNNIASIDLTIGNHRMAESVSMLKEVTDYCQTHRLRFLSVIANYNYGTALHYLNRQEEAFDAFDRSLEAARSIGDDLGVAYALTGQARSLRQQKKFDEAIPLLRRAMPIAQQFDDQSILVLIQENLAWCLLESRQTREAVPIVEDLMQKANVSLIQSTMTEALALKGRLHEELGEEKLAMIAYRQLSELQVSIFDAKNQELTARNLAEFEVDRREERNQLLTQKNQIQKLEIENQERNNQILILSLCGSLGLAALISFEIIQLRRRNREIQKLQGYIERNVLQRFLPPVLVQEILAGRSRLDEHARSEIVTVLFADLCDFTRATERLGPQTIAHILNDFFMKMTDIVFEEGGTVDKFIGDAIMVIFGAPTTIPPDVQAQRAVRCAQRMQKHLGELNKSWELSEGQHFFMRIGIHQGLAVVGSFGGKRRSDYTVVGTAVNIAARVENLAEPQSILITPEIVKYLSPAVYRLRGSFSIRGLNDAMDLYEVHLEASLEPLDQVS
jgi:class 3 adenylate cyclase/tetratricopeptide (TPR) repeat protein